MAISPRYGLTDDPQARFFLAPESPLQRQYEALRAYFVERLPSHEVARRFGYTPGSFRVLCHQFRHDPAKRAAFFPAARQGPHRAPPHAIASATWSSPCANATSPSTTSSASWPPPGTHISINALAILLREEGFARLPRRLDDERPQATPARGGRHGRRPRP